MTGLALAEVLEEHQWMWRVFQGRPILMCSCGDELIPVTSSGVATLESHRAHVAAAVTAWLAERLGSEEVRETVARSIVSADDAAYVDGREGATADDAADAALTAVLAALEVER